MGRRNSEQAVDRIVETKSPTLDLVVREAHTVNGELLRDRIARDRKALPTGARLGACYFKGVLMEWSGAATVGRH